jgi:hypothetical protein
MSIDKSLARGLASRSRDEAIAKCKAQVDQLLGLFSEAILQEGEGTRRAKVVRSLVQALERLSHRPGFIGHLQKIPGRSRAYSYFFVGPNFSDEAIFYGLFFGTLNERKPIEFPENSDVLMVTRHVLQRLHQRLDTLEPERVSAELASAAVQALKFRRTADMLGLKQWPLPSFAGVFVAAPGGDSDLTTLVTWLPREGLGSKWGGICEQLDAIPNVRIFGNGPCVDLAALLDGYAWLKCDYQPPSDEEGGYWASAR